jgi:chaperonin GroES
MDGLRARRTRSGSQSRLTAELLSDTYLEVDERIFDGDGIRRLYDSEDYPLVRRASPVTAVNIKHFFQGMGDTDEIPPAARSFRRQAHRRRGEVRRRHHHPGHRKGKPSQGEITAVGPGGRDENGKLIPIDLKVGEYILFGKWSGTEVVLDGMELLIMKESDIMGVLEETAAKKKAA